MSKRSLPTVTLCAAASVNVEATVTALRRCLDQVDFAKCLLFTDQIEWAEAEAGIQPVRIARLKSAADYSNFLLRELVGYIETDHCLVVQWDGFVVDAHSWSDEFLAHDYVGAPWPQFSDGHDVGNGGFSLRSRRLLLACLDPAFIGSHPEDVAICRVNRNLLEEQHGINFASRDIAARFSHERGRSAEHTFGFHGIFNMIPLLGQDGFWKAYTSLDDPSTAFVDYARLVRQLGTGRAGVKRILRLTFDALRRSFRGVG